MRLAVLVSTYRQPAMLDATLASLARQRLPADEILVADDGSDDPTRAVVDAHRAAGLPVLHLWQGDLGFRLARQGWHTAVLASTTWEEAPIRFGQWFRQRTRWLKGWMQTYLVCT